MQEGQAAEGRRRGGIPDVDVPQVGAVLCFFTASGMQSWAGVTMLVSQTWKVRAQTVPGKVAFLM